MVRNCRLSIMADRFVLALKQLRTFYTCMIRLILNHGHCSVDHDSPPSGMASWVKGGQQAEPPQVSFSSFLSHFLVHALYTYLKCVYTFMVTSQNVSPDVAATLLAHPPCHSLESASPPKMWPFSSLLTFFGEPRENTLNIWHFNHQVWEHMLWRTAAMV